MYEADLNNFLALAEELKVKGLISGKNISEGNSNHLLQSNSCHQSLFKSNLEARSDNQPTAPTFPTKLPAHVHTQTPSKTDLGSSAFENNNAAGVGPVEMKSEPGLELLNSSQARGLY